MNDNPAANDRNINIKKCVAGICLAGAMVGAWAQGILVTPPPKSAGPFNTLSAAAENAGLKACKAAIDRLSSLAIQGTQANEVLLDWDAKNLPDALLWISNGGRAHAPWAGTHYALGIEPDNSCFDLTSVPTPPEAHPLAKRTGIRLHAGVPLRIAYRLFARAL